MDHALTRYTRTIAPIVLLGIGLVAGSCSNPFKTGARSIARHPERFNGQTMTVSGTVKERIDLAVRNCYVLDDGTGLIGVVTKRPMPRIGAKVTAHGRVDTSFKLGKRPLVAIIEPDPPPTPRPSEPLPEKMPG